MNAPEPIQTFEAARRRQLIEATIETVSEVGFRAASLGEIARLANVSPGLFAHYFGDKDGLLEATLRFMAGRLARATAARMRAAPSPLERVMAVHESALAEEEFEPRTSAVWLAFWGQIMHSEPYRRVQSIYQRRMRSNLRHGLRSLVAADKVASHAVLIAATIDGLWLQSHASRRKRDDGSRARAAVRSLIVILIGDRDEADIRISPEIERAQITNDVTNALRDQRRALARLEAAARRLAGAD